MTILVHLQPGHVIAPYRVGEEIGHGGRSAACRAWQRTTGRRVALKVLRPRDPELLGDSHHEARLTANIGHSYVRKVHWADYATSCHRRRGLWLTKTQERNPNQYA